MHRAGLCRAPADGHGTGKATTQRSKSRYGSLLTARLKRSSMAILPGCVFAPAMIAAGSSKIRRATAAAAGATPATAAIENTCASSASESAADDGLAHQNHPLESGNSGRVSFAFDAGLPRFDHGVSIRGGSTRSLGPAPGRLYVRPLRHPDRTRTGGAHLRTGFLNANVPDAERTSCAGAGKFCIAAIGRPRVAPREHLHAACVARDPDARRVRH